MASGGKQRGLIIIVIALVLIAILGVAYFVLSSRGTNILAPAQQPGGAAAPAPTTKMTSIVITTQKIPRGTVITESVITTLAYPEKDLVPGTFFTNPKDVINKQAKYDLEPRMPITEALLVTGQAGVGSYAAFQIPKGYVAVSMPINRLSAVSFAPVVGDHINIIASMLVVDIDQAAQSKLPNYLAKVVPEVGASEADPGSLTATSGGKSGEQGRVEIDSTLQHPVYVVPSEVQRPRLVSQMVIQDAIILRMGNFPLNEIAKTSGVEPTAQPASGDANQAAVTPTAPDIMTLIVRPQDAITLNYLQQTGAKLTLALRSAGDIDPAAVEAVTLQYLFQTYNIPNPPKTNFGIEPRLDNIPTNTTSAQPTPAPQ
jgi:pilus assembly protein CpaB